MLSISHTLTGAFIASKLPLPLAAPLILASHYFEDWIPHWDLGTGLSNGKRKKSTALRLEIVELIISFVLIFWFWRQSDNRQLIEIYSGAFIALIPDFLEAPRNFLNWEPKFLQAINRFHGRFHHSMPNMLWGLAPQIMLWIIIYFIK